MDPMASPQSNPKPSDSPGKLKAKKVTASKLRRKFTFKAPRMSGMVASAEEINDVDQNSIEILKDENRHLKRLLERMEISQETALGTSDDRRLQEELERVKKELYQREVKDLEMKNQMEQQRMSDKANRDKLEKNLEELTLQLQFITSQHEGEIVEKRNEIESLESKLMSLNEELAGFLAKPAIDEASIDVSYLQDRVTKLSHIVDSCQTQISRKDKEISDLSNRVLNANVKDQSLAVAALEDSLGFYKKKLETAENTIGEMREVAAKLRIELKDAYLDLRAKKEEISTLNDTIEKMHRTISLYRSTDQSAEGNIQTEALLQEKIQVIWDLKDRLLEASTTIHKLEKKLEGTSDRKTSGTKTKKRKGNKAVEDKEQKPVVNNVEEAKFVAEGLDERDASKNYKEMLVASKQLHAEKLRVAELKLEIKKLEVENNSLKLGSTQATRSMGALRTVVVPLPTETPANELDLLRVELHLKDTALQRLSLKNQHLIERMEAAQVAEKLDGSGVLVEEINTLHKRLIVAKETIENLEKEKEELLRRIEQLYTQNATLQEDAVVLRTNYVESQKHFGDTARKYKEDSAALATMVGRAFSDADRLQLLLHNEKARNLATAEELNNEFAALRDRALKNQGLPKDLFMKDETSVAASDEENVQNEWRSGKSLQSNAAKSTENLNAKQPQQTQRSLTTHISPPKATDLDPVNTNTSNQIHIPKGSTVFNPSTGLYTVNYSESKKNLGTWKGRSARSFVPYGNGITQPTFREVFDSGQHSWPHMISQSPSQNRHIIAGSDVIYDGPASSVLVGGNSTKTVYSYPGVVSNTYVGKNANGFYLQSTNAALSNPSFESPLYQHISHVPAQQAHPAKIVKAGIVTKGDAAIMAAADAPVKSPYKQSGIPASKAVASTNPVKTTQYPLSKSGTRNGTIKPGSVGTSATPRVALGNKKAVSHLNFNKGSNSLRQDGLDTLLSPIKKAENTPVAVAPVQAMEMDFS